MSVQALQGAKHHIPKVIVVVDDDEDIGTLITELIHEHTTHEVQHYTTGTQVLQAMSTSLAHLFILDYTLPDMSGLELHDRLRTLEHLRSVPILLISAMKPPLRELQKRAITFLAKPFDVMKLLRTLTELLA
ncbi:MAG TPA: response regulator [Ktedonobacteraceae bacterium]|nr:response regulator [Ktedonobacteraceae bacterium]